jgi:hypothetical protein
MIAFKQQMQLPQGQQQQAYLLLQLAFLLPLLGLLQLCLLYLPIVLIKLLIYL